MARIEMPDGASVADQNAAKRAVAHRLLYPPTEPEGRISTLVRALRPLGARAFFGGGIYYHDVPPERIEPATHYAGPTPQH
jgi:hypothetical protein